MKALGLILDKHLRNTVAVSMLLHAFCLSFFSFTFVDKINFPMDFKVDFLGSILKEADITDTYKESNYSNAVIPGSFISINYAPLNVLDYHLSTNKPDRIQINMFTEKKNSAKSIFLFLEPAAEKEEDIEKIEVIEQAPEWDKELKLKIE